MTCVSFLPVVASGRRILQAVLHSDLTWLCLAVGLLCLVVIVLAARVLWRTGHHAPPTASASDEQAVATIEFALVCPILLFMMLLLAQTTLLMGGNIFVHYAAYAATRSAITYIPQDTTEPGPWPVTGTGEPANVFTASPGYLKYNAIQQAAALALLPVAGRADSGSNRSQAIVDGLRGYFSAQGHNPPNWVDRLIPQRVHYAVQNTDIQVMLARVVDQATVEFIKIPQGTTHVFRPRDPITVNVIHQLNLAVPWVNRIYADGSNGDHRHYRQVSATCTLTNEGIRDELPPEPTLPRNP